MMDRELYAKIDAQDWIRCRKCRHKLMRVVVDISEANKATGQVLELKCHSCRSLNLWDGNSEANRLLNDIKASCKATE